VTGPGPTVMILVGCYLPGFRGGGPIQSVWNLTEALGSGQQLLVVTADRDAGSDRPYDGIHDGVFQPLGKCSVRYLKPWEKGLSLRRLLRSTPYDVLYVNSFFSPRFSILPMTLRRFGAIPRTPVVVAPRGEFSPGALGLKAAKKRLWIRISRLLGLYRDAIWHATTDDEADLIKSVIGTGAQVVVLNQLVSDARAEGSETEFPRPVKEPGRARVVFLSRISRKKNLRYAASLVALVDRGSVVFDVYGPIEDENYWRSCQRMMTESLDQRVSMKYRGELPHSQVEAVLSQYDLFLLPTRGENYGHVIAEALAAGCPVAVSDRTPWGKIEEEGAGWVVPLDDERRWKSVIQEVVDASEDELNARRTAAKRLAHAQISSQRDVEGYRRLFRAGG